MAGGQPRGIAVDRLRARRDVDPSAGTGQPHIALALGAELFAESLAVLHFCTRDEILLAWDTFHRYSDKEWSFTDCLSKVVMERLAIRTAFAFDQHFRQFGSVLVVP